MSANRFSDSRRRRHKLLIRRLVETDDGKGAYISSWTTIAAPWAEVEGLAGREAVMDQTLQSVSVFRFRTRWREDILAADQIRHGSIDLNISSVADPDGMRRDLVIVATTEGVRQPAP